MFDFLKKKISSWIGTDKTKSTKKEKKKPAKAKKVSTPKKEVKKPQTLKKASVEKIVQVVQEDKPQQKHEPKKLTKSEQVLQEEVDDILEEAQPDEEKEEKQGFFAKLVNKISTSKLSSEDFDELFMELEITLLENNVALEAVDKIKENLSQSLVDQHVKKAQAQSRILAALKESILNLLIEPPSLLDAIKKKEGVYTMIFFGINGTGKTTSIAKVAHFLQKNDISCVLAAADTFRAASIEQLKTHADRLSLPIVAHQYNSDPAAVAFDAKKYAAAHGIKVVLIDTAGRMYTKENLLKEMEKIIRVSQPDLKLFVGESITGNDAIDQAKTFNEVIGVDGIILTKADVDEKAGTILSVSHITHKPIYFLGTGQNYDDLTPFKKKDVLKHLGLD